MSDQIFISYRRDGGDITAKLICEALKNKGYTVFYDFDSLKGGVFDSKIFEALDQCTDVILVLPKNALSRCKNENDWVRQEIKYALEKKKNIIPVMLDGFRFPQKLPPDIQEIALYNGVRFYMDFFESVIDKIIEKLSIAEKATSPSASPLQESSQVTPHRPKKYDICLSTERDSWIMLRSRWDEKKLRINSKISNEEWKQLSDIIKKIFAVLFRTSEKMVSVTQDDPSESGIVYFKVNYLSNYKPDYYHSLLIKIEQRNSVELCPFDINGNYVFHSVPAETPLSYFEIDELELIEVIKPLVTFVENTSQISFSDHFETKVYSDCSGGYYLKYLIPD